MIKSIAVDKTDAIPEEPVFPALYRHNTGMIVLFTDLKKGFVVFDDQDSVFEIGGGSRTEWLACTEPDWTLFKGQVVLQNSR